ncbi:MAG: baseplate J/gp47 family protein [Acidobacteria bacterium]|nr:baseplate J/gp47 family protein [Acidobacteriota bacterium]
MTFEPKKFDDVFTAMRQRAEAGGVISDFEVGSVARTLTESFSYEIALLYEQMRLVYLSAFVDTAEGQQLDMVVSILGVTRGEPDFAEGVVTLQRDAGNEAVDIPSGTQVATADKPGAPKKVYQTVEPQTLLKDQTSMDVRVQALNRGEGEVVPAGAIAVMPRPVPGIKSVVNANATIFKGKRRETDDELRSRAKNALIASGKASVTAIESALVSLPGVRDVRVIEAPEPGVIDVFVDGTGFGEQSEPRRVLDSVRAAGIFARLKAATPLEIDGVFRIEINPALKPSPQERAAIENDVQLQIVSYIESLKMGDPLLPSQITKSILSVKGVNDLVSFTLSINRRDEHGTVTPVPFNPDTDRRVVSQPSERFQPTMICVASEDKPLPIDIAFQAGAGLTAATYQNLAGLLKGYFDGLATGAPVAITEVTQRIANSGITLVPDSLVVTPEPWCGSVSVAGGAIPVRFVEKAALGDVLAYNSTLKITGAIRLTLPSSLTDAASQSVQSAVRQKLEAYLAGLKPGANVLFKEMAGVARTVDPVQDVGVADSDFRARLDDGPPLPDRVEAEKINVKAFEKAALENFCIASGTQVIDVTITKVDVRVTVPGPAPAGSALTQKQNEIKNGIAGKALLEKMGTGENLRYEAVQKAIEALIPGTSYAVTALEMTGVSRCDGRTQTLASAGTLLHVRTVEIASLKPIGISAVTVTVIGTTPTPAP